MLFRSTGLLPTEVSVYGIVDQYPNGNDGYLWTDARVLWENGASLNVINAIGYPDAASEKEILRAGGGAGPAPACAVLTGEEMIALQQQVHEIRVDDAIVDYMMAIVERTRAHDSLALGVSPRGAQALTLASKINAMLDGRYNVSFDDVKKAVLPALRHRLLLNFEGEAEGLSPDFVLNDILDHLKSVGEEAA